MMHLESLGWGYVWDPIHKGIEHSGGHLGFHAYVRAYPGLKIGVVALTNSNNPVTEQYPSEEIAQAVLAEVKKEMLAQATFDSEQVDLSRYVGMYTLPGTGAEMSIELRDGHLHATVLPDSSFNHEINPVGADEFGINGASEPWLFFTEDNGHGIQSLRFMGFTFERDH